MHRKEPVQPDEWLKFKAHGHRYIVDVFKRHSTTLIGGDDWAKFKRDFNMCQGKKLVFDMSGRMPHAYVCYVGGGLAAVHGGPAQDMAGDDVGQRGGAGDFPVDGVEEVTNASHGVEAAPDIYTRGVVLSDGEGQMLGLVITIEDGYAPDIYTRGVVLSDGEGQMLGLVITIEDGYIGPHFVHRLTPTNITSKSMKIRKKIVPTTELGSRRGCCALHGCRRGDAARISHGS